MNAIRGCLIIVGGVAILLGILLLLAVLTGRQVLAGMDNPILSIIFVLAFILLGVVLILIGTKRLRNLFRF